MKKARGALLFKEYQKKMGMVQPDAATTTTAAPAPQRQKIGES
jgi:hypothetical protein